MLDVFFPTDFTVKGGKKKKLQKDDLHIFTQLDISYVTFEVRCSAERLLAEQRRSMRRSLFSLDHSVIFKV